MNEYKKIAIYIDDHIAALAKGDLKMSFCDVFEETAYLEFDKHTALAVAEVLYKYYQSQDKGADKVIRDMLKQTATPMFSVIDKDHKIQKHMDEVKSVLEREKDNAPGLYIKTVFAEHEDKIILQALKCLRAYALGDIVRSCAVCSNCTEESEYE